MALERMENHSVAEVVSFLKDASVGAYDMLLLSGDGNFLDRSGQRGLKQISKDLLPLMQGEDRVLLLRQEKDTDILTFGKRIKPLSVDTEKMDYLFVYYKLDSYLELLKMESFGGNGHIRIIDSRGATLLHSDNLPDSENRYLFFSTFKGAEFYRHGAIKAIDSFREYVLFGKSNAIHVKLASGEDEIVSFAKIPDTNWYIIISIDQSLVMGTRLLSVEKISKTSMLSVISGQIHAKQLELYMDVMDVTDEDVFCDKTRLNQVLLNLLSNAIKFTPAGGTVSVRVAQPQTGSFIDQHEAEHHLDRQQRGMKIPNNGGPLP